MLTVADLNAWYGLSHVLQGVTLEIGQGEIVAIMGRNGAGKTTTLKSVMGLVDRRAGSVVFQGREILAEPTHLRFALGLGYVPEERRIVPSLTVRENLRLGLLASPNRARETLIINHIAATFPRLKERLDQFGDTMSGGEQQMLAIARAMVSDPKMIMLDEPTEGVMPVLVDEMLSLFVELKRQGTALLLVEQNVDLALDIADRAYIMDHGTIVHHASAQSLRANKEVQERYCSV